MAYSGWDKLPKLIEKFQRESGMTAEQVIRGTFFKLAGAIISDTPVDEGITQGNWYFTEGSPSSSYDKDSKRKQDEITQPINSADISSTWYLTNNSPQILVLENGGYKNAEGAPANGPNTVSGYSKQAPRGMVVVNITRFGKIIAEETS